MCRGCAEVLEVRQVVIQGCSLAAALTTMHHNSIVHLDLHPGNVLQDWGSNWVLADCGNAVFTKSQDQANWQHESRHVTSALVNHDVRTRVYIWHDSTQLQACVGSCWLNACFANLLCNQMQELWMFTALTSFVLF